MTATYDNEGVRVYRVPACYFCQVEGQILYPDMRDRLFCASGLWHLRRCRLCGLIWLDPQPIGEDSGKLYTHYMTHRLSEQTTKSWASFRQEVKQAILARSFGYTDVKTDSVGGTLGQTLAWMGSFRDGAGAMVMWLEASRRGRLLDVGCGNGQFLATMRELGWEVKGVEPDRTAAGIAQERFGLDVTCGSLSEAGLAENTFDAVTLSHVIEHLANPKCVLSECQRLLRKSGRLVLVTPNIDSLGHRWFRKPWLGLDPPRHLFLFSPQTLRLCAEGAGLRVVELRTLSRLASWVWASSRVISRVGYITQEQLQKPRHHLRLEGLAFKGMEELLTFFLDVGEEVLLVAARG